MRNKLLNYCLFLSLLFNQSQAFSADKGTAETKLSSTEKGNAAKTRGSDTAPAKNSHPGTGNFVVNNRGTIFDFDEYWELMGPLETKEEERLCGLDKYCIDRWKHGKLRIYKEGHVFARDFNEDGKPDEAFVLEKDNLNAPLGKEYLIYITSKGQVVAGNPSRSRGLLGREKQSSGN